MATITFKGSTIHTVGDLPKIGSQAPEFTLTKTDLSEISSNDLKGKNVVLNIFVSIDTSVCQASVRKFNAEAEKLSNTVVLCVSKDLPFAHNRFCGAEGLKNVVPASDFKNLSFSEKYGVKISDGPVAGLMSRAVVVLNDKGTVVYTEQVPEVTTEPNYENALKALKETSLKS